MEYNVGKSFKSNQLWQKSQENEEETGGFDVLKRGSEGYSL
jgi:hypothetical protein